MPRFTTISLFLLFTLPIWVKGVVLVHFMLNRAYIVAYYCENKDKPQLHCEGKCYLYKQLQKTGPSESDATPSSAANWLKNWELAEFDLPTRFFEIQAGFCKVICPFSPYLSTALHGFPDVLEPPPD